jgi:hypothetical protein
MVRRFFDEAAREAGASAVSIYLDIASFYDCIQPALTIRELLRHNFCPFTLRLIAHQHGMPRRLKVGRCLSLPITLGKSVLAGCGWSNSVASATPITPLWKLGTTSSPRT